jgi:phage terminase Nu1 subunit (DNA packaging protein)
MATQDQVAAHIDLSGRQVRDLLGRGILPASKGRGGLNADACRLAYIRYLRGLHRKQISEPDSGPMDVDVDKERALNLRADTRLKELKEAQLRKELAPIQLLEMVLGKTCAQISAALEAIPLKVKRMVPKLSNAEVEIIRREIIKCQNIAAESTLNIDEFDRGTTLQDRSLSG